MSPLEHYLKQFGTISVSNVTQVGTRFYSVIEAIEETRKKIQDRPFSMGLFLGEQKRDFQPSAALLEIIAKQTEKKIAVNTKSEWLFVCGRDIFEPGILTIDKLQDLKQSELILVQNEHDENLGLGRVQSKDGKIMIKNVFDRGSFLRRE
jgi:ribosome biogenesis protein Nip4